MKLPVNITQEVWQEIDDITQYIFQNSDIDKTDDFYSAFEHVIETVMENAEIGRLSDRSHDVIIRHYLMPRPFQRYAVFWEIINNESVEIFHVRHTARKEIDVSMVEFEV